MRYFGGEELVNVEQAKKVELKKQLILPRK